MGQRAPSTAQIAVAVAFAFSCFGLLLFLWSAFGGPVPFAPEGYRVKVPFNEATQLAVESDVRISNVSVGRVKKIELGEEDELERQERQKLEGIKKTIVTEIVRVGPGDEEDGIRKP